MAAGAEATLSETAAAEAASKMRARVVMMVIPSKTGCKRLMSPLCSTPLWPRLLPRGPQNFL
jgi:hypothetical protein